MTRPGLGSEFIGVYDHPPPEDMPYMHSIHLADTTFYDPGGAVSAARATTGFVDRWTRYFQDLL